MTTRQRNDNFTEYADKYCLEKKREFCNISIGADVSGHMSENRVKRVKISHGREKGR